MKETSMKKFILLYEKADWADQGGGLNMEEFTAAADMNERASELLSKNTSDCVLYENVRGLVLSRAMTYEPVERVIEHRPKTMGVQFNALK